MARITHPNVRLIDFSPCERYMATWSNDPVVIPDDAPVTRTVFPARRLDAEAENADIVRARRGVDGFFLR